MASQTGPDFAAEIPDDGYAWWYVDALSDCGQHGLTLIAMLGCVFSPYYARARRRGPTAALEHSALNVALYRGDGRRWAMTERGAAAVQRERHALQIGPSALHWSADGLDIAIDETTAPWPRTLRGKIRVLPTALTAQSWALDPAGRHLWWPIAVRARIEVQLSQPQLTWRGSAYFDANQGVVPLEHDFDRWSWSRAHRRDDAIVFYDTVSRNGEPAAELALRFDHGGRAEPFGAPPKAKVKRTGWGIERPTRCDAGLQPRLIETLESAPFYARSLLETTITGSSMQAFHESVSLSRFTSRWVQTLLPVRLPRR